MNNEEDYYMIQGLFNEEDFKAIWSTPIPHRMGRERVIWSAVKTGEYSARDGYRFWNDQYLTTTQVPRSMGWNKIWKLTVPHKIRVFLWRLGRNNLPLCSALIRKGIMLDDVCPFCRTVGESVKHIFVQCEFVKT